jgi:hypothetical protein
MAMAKDVVEERCEATQNGLTQLNRLALRNWRINLVALIHAYYRKRKQEVVMRGGLSPRIKDLMRMLESKAAILIARRAPWKGSENVTPIEEPETLPTTFKALPTEIRLKIWRTTWEPRTVEVYMHTTDKAQDDANLFSSSIYRSTSPLPATLSICSESRYETLKHYKPSFAAYQKQPQVYFNHQIDTLYLRDIDILWFMEFPLMFPHEDITKIRHLALTERYFQSIYKEPEAGSIKSSEGLLGLESLTVVLNDNNNPDYNQAYSWLRGCLCSPQHGFRPLVKIAAREGAGLEIFVKELRKGIMVPGNERAFLPAHWGVRMPCCRPNPLELLRVLRELDRRDGGRFQETLRQDQVLQELRCKCRFISILSIRYTRLYDDDTGVCRLRELRELCRKWKGYAPPRRDWKLPFGGR